MAKGNVQKPEAFPQNEKHILAATLENFAEHRRLLQEFCGLHLASLDYFHTGISFKVTADEADADPSNKTAQHLSSTATCYSSIEDCPKIRTERVTQLLADGKEFAEAAIARSIWQSDGSADIYCRCRTLPFVLSHMMGWHQEVDGHLATIFKQWNDFERTAIGEADPQAPDKREWYPPNAYHTFWALEAIDTYRQQYRLASRYRSIAKTLNLETRRLSMHHWAYQRLTYEISLHSAQSSALDSDQLAWSLAVFLRDPEHYRSKVPAQDLIRQAFKCLFDTQEKTGAWLHYSPLFHYRYSGNAYCYVFETFAWLLKQTLRTGADFTRTLLKQYFGNLVDLWKYALATQTTTDEGHQLAWSSGHRVNQLPESWATASVFAYSQALRRLVDCRGVTITRLLASKLSWRLAAISCSPSNSIPT